jgi:hypothetical protein
MAKASSAACSASDQWPSLIAAFVDGELRESGDMISSDYIKVISKKGFKT